VKTTVVAVAAGLTYALVLRRRARNKKNRAMIPYDEFSLFHENCAEFGIPYKGPPTVSRERVVLADGRVIAALKWGDAPPELVLLHGGAQNAHTWDTVALALDRPLLAIDLPGHGHSDDFKDGYDSASAGADIAAVIDALAPNPKAVCGMSMGGMVSIELCALRPDLVKRLVLVDVTPGVNKKKASQIINFVLGPESFDSFDDILARTVKYNPTRSESSLRRGILHNALQRPDGTWVWRHARHRHRERLRQVNHQRQNHPEEYLHLWAKLGTLAGSQTPCVLCRGKRKSSVVDDADEAELLRRVPHARVVPFSEAGHSVQGDQPLELAALLGKELV